MLKNVNILRVNNPLTTGYCEEEGGENIGIFRSEQQAEHFLTKSNAQKPYSMFTRNAQIAVQLNDFGTHARRFESAEAASCLVVLLVLPLRSTFDALEATLPEVLAEFFAIRSPPFQWHSDESGRRAEAVAGMWEYLATRGDQKWK